MKKILGKALIGTLAALLITGSLERQMNKVKATAYSQDTALEEDEVLVKGGGSSFYVLNSNYSVLTEDNFHDVVYDYVGQGVKIWDVENNLKSDLNKLRHHQLKHPEGYHLMTNDERNDIVNGAKKENLSFREHLDRAGMKDMRYAPAHLTTACGGPNRVWHYSDTFIEITEDGFKHCRELYFEKFNINRNCFDNTKIGVINCNTEDHDRFTLPRYPSKKWRYIEDYGNDLARFLNNKYLLLYVKN